MGEARLNAAKLKVSQSADLEDAWAELDAANETLRWVPPSAPFAKLRSGDCRPQSLRGSVQGLDFGIAVGSAVSPLTELEPADLPAVEFKWDDDRRRSSICIFGQAFI